MKSKEPLIGEWLGLLISGRRTWVVLEQVSYPFISNEGDKDTYLWAIITLECDKA
jgi:hypothetical protein